MLLVWKFNIVAELLFIRPSILRILYLHFLRFGRDCWYSQTLVIRELEMSAWGDRLCDESTGLWTGEPRPRQATLTAAKGAMSFVCVFFQFNQFVENALHWRILFSQCVEQCWTCIVLPNFIVQIQLGLVQVCQRGIPACKEIMEAIGNGAKDVNKVYKVFVMDALPSRLA